MANLQHGNPGQGWLPPYPVRSRRIFTAKSWSRFFEEGSQFSVADLYPDGYSS